MGIHFDKFIRRLLTTQSVQKWIFLPYELNTLTHPRIGEFRLGVGTETWMYLYLYLSVLFVVCLSLTVLSYCLSVLNYPVSFVYLSLSALRVFFVYLYLSLFLSFFVSTFLITLSNYPYFIFVFF